MPSLPFPHPHSDYTAIDLFQPLRRWIDSIQVRDCRLAHFLCEFIPCRCPFERTIHVLGHTIHIPPLCKLNPLYDEVIGLRVRALSYLAETCHEDITPYVC